MGEGRASSVSQLSLSLRLAHAIPSFHLALPVRPPHHSSWCLADCTLHLLIPSLGTDPLLVPACTPARLLVGLSQFTETRHVCALYPQEQLSYLYPVWHELL